jgi:hypothetical protein
MPQGPAPVAAFARGPCQSITAIPTRLLVLSPAFRSALKELAPKRRRAKIPYVILLGLITVVAVLGADRPTRDFAVTKGRQVSLHWHEELARTLKGGRGSAGHDLGHDLGHEVGHDPGHGIPAVVPVAHTPVLREPAIVAEEPAESMATPIVFSTVKIATPKKALPRRPARAMSRHPS